MFRLEFCIMIEAVTIKGVTLGSGRPKICVPVVGHTVEEIECQAKAAAGTRADLMEWRVDFFQDWQDTERVVEVLARVEELVAPRSVLFTFRTDREGGEAAITPEAYAELNLAAARSGHAALVDVELFFGDDFIRELTGALQQAGAKVICSNHNFDKTPAEEEIVHRLCRMQELGADVLKIAVMPVCTEDVLTLLSATVKMQKEHARKPLVTMSMSGMGVVSRLAGEAFGSAMTFGAAGKASAPGQIGVEDLHQILEVLHKSAPVSYE